MGAVLVLAVWAVLAGVFLRRSWEFPDDEAPERVSLGHGEHTFLVGREPRP